MATYTIRLSSDERVNLITALYAKSLTTSVPEDRIQPMEDLRKRLEELLPDPLPTMIKCPDEEGGNYGGEIPK